LPLERVSGDIFDLCELGPNQTFRGACPIADDITSIALARRPASITED
jgi:hypothetical protein